MIHESVIQTSFLNGSFIHDRVTHNTILLVLYWTLIDAARKSKADVKIFNNNSGCSSHKFIKHLGKKNRIDILPCFLIINIETFLNKKKSKLSQFNLKTRKVSTTGVRKILSLKKLNSKETNLFFLFSAKAHLILIFFFFKKTSYIVQYSECILLCSIEKKKMRKWYRI